MSHILVALGFVPTLIIDRGAESSDPNRIDTKIHNSLFAEGWSRLTPIGLTPKLILEPSAKIKCFITYVCCRGG